MGVKLGFRVTRRVFRLRPKRLDQRHTAEERQQPSTEARDTQAAKRLLGKLLKRQMRPPRVMVTGRSAIFVASAALQVMRVVAPATTLTAGVPRQA